MKIHGNQKYVGGSWAFRAFSDPHGLTCLFVFVLFLATGSSSQTPKPSTSRESTTTRKLMEREALQRSAISANPQAPERHGELGRTLIQEGKYEAATEELGTAVNQLPASRLYNMALAEALLGWGHFGVAVEFLMAVAERFQQFPEFHYYLGLANFKLNKSTVALPEFEEALRLDPNLHLAKFGLAACRATNGDLQGAADLSRALVREHPNNPRYWLALAQVLNAIGQSAWLEGLQASRRALALKPGDPVIELQTAVILVHLEKYAGARPLLEHVVKSDPDNLQAHVELAGVYSHLGERALVGKEREIVAQLEKSKAEAAPDNSFPPPAPPD
jgi:predicted Zn-dependent protease